ncbi:uncharacterized protein LOC126203698 [Schistocerca nitens]|uniref:uncharacterized protein LOC126203698 n=1 Tax=Schistocerca nitens TaxID=7011 RepID=UPI00211785BE|nr:uncharacterized protein LOC126203698 [Schistocerca nitens]
MAVTDLIRSPSFLIKVVELVLSIIIAGLTTGQAVAASPDIYVRLAVVDGTIVCYIILGVLIIIGYVLECPIHTKLILISSAAACVLFVTTGGLILDAYTRSYFKVTQVIIAGILALVNGVVYAADAFLSWKFS